MRKAKPYLFYMLRLALAGAAFLGLLYGLLAVAHVVLWDGDYLIALLSQFDVFHHLLYSGLGLALGIVFLSLDLRFLRAEHLGRARYLIYLGAALVLGALPVAAVAIARPRLSLPWYAFLSSAYAALNVFLLAFTARISERPKWNAFFRRAIVLADLTTPLLVWSAYRGPTRRLRGWQIFPVLLIIASTFVAWLARPINAPDGRCATANPAIGLVWRKGLYQIEVDQTDGNLILAGNKNEILKLDPANVEVTKRITIEPAHHSDQGFGFDPRGREILYADPCSGYSFAFDETDLRVLRRVPMQNYREHLTRLCADPVPHGNRVQWSAEGGILVAFTFSPGLTIINRPGDRILVDADEFFKFARPSPGNTADVAIDPADRKVHWISTRPVLAAFDVDQQRLSGWLPLPSSPERIALDAERRRLFVTLPILGQVLVIDPKDYRRITTIDSFSGVRVIALDPDHDRFFLGGFTPLLEIRSLSDFSLQDRIVAPSWQRWIAVNGKKEIAYLNANCDGAALWALDLRRLAADRRGAFWRKIDPGYPLLRALAAGARRLILLLKPPSEMFSSLPPNVLDAAWARG